MSGWMLYGDRRSGSAAVEMALAEAGTGVTVRDVRLDDGARQQPRRVLRGVRDVCMLARGACAMERLQDGQQVRERLAAARLGGEQRRARRAVRREEVRERLGLRHGRPLSRAEHRVDLR